MPDLRWLRLSPVQAQPLEFNLDPFLTLVHCNVSAVALLGALPEALGRVGREGHPRGK